MYWVPFENGPFDAVQARLGLQGSRDRQAVHFMLDEAHIVSPVLL